MSTWDSPHIVVLNIDGLIPRVLADELRTHSLPNLEFILGGLPPEDILIPTTSTAPSITFCAQATIATGVHPSQHGIAGNDSFDRLGRLSHGAPRHYGFDVGDTYAIDDAVSAFTRRRADTFLRSDVTTLYDEIASNGGTSIVAHSMYGRGASTVLSPRILELARLTKLRGVLGFRRGGFDALMLRRALGGVRSRGAFPPLLSLYFMGLDKEAHERGPHTQGAYLREVLDKQIGEVVNTCLELRVLDKTIFVIVSDHGQSATPGDDAHSIRLGFPFDHELTHLFHALNLDVHDMPGEDPHVDAVVGLNGGLAHVYLRHGQDAWRVPPRMGEDSLRVAEAFFEMNRTGRYCEELRNSLFAVLVRDAASDGWHGPYKWYRGDGSLAPLSELFGDTMHDSFPDAENRILACSSEMSGDLILLSDMTRGVYFGKPGLRGVHGGVHAEDSFTTLAIGGPGLSTNDLNRARSRVRTICEERAKSEGRRFASLADITPAILALVREVPGRALSLDAQHVSGSE